MWDQGQPSQHRGYKPRTKRADRRNPRWRHWGHRPIPIGRQLYEVARDKARGNAQATQCGNQ